MPPATRYLFTLARILGIISLLPFQASLATPMLVYLVCLLCYRGVMVFCSHKLIFLNASVILEQDASNCAQMYSEARLTSTKVSRRPVPQRRVVITNKRIEDEKELNRSYWLAFVAKLNPFYWFSNKWKGPTVPLSLGGCNATPLHAFWYLITPRFTRNS